MSRGYSHAELLMLWVMVIIPIVTIPVHWVMVIINITTETKHGNHSDLWSPWLLYIDLAPCQLTGMCPMIATAHDNSQCACKQANTVAVDILDTIQITSDIFNAPKYCECILPQEKTTSLRNSTVQRFQYCNALWPLREDKIRSWYVEVHNRHIARSCEVVLSWRLKTQQYSPEVLSYLSGSMHEPCTAYLVPCMPVESVSACRGLKCRVS